MMEQCKNIKDMSNEDFNVKNFLDIIKYAIHKKLPEELPQLHEPVEWDSIAKIATEHNLFALFHEVAYEYPEYKELSNYEIYSKRAIGVVAQQIKKTERFLELYRDFLEEDIHPIVMKGLICRQLYGKYADHRPSGDEDILISVEEFSTVKKIMEEKGFVCNNPNVTNLQLQELQEVDFYKKSCKFLIEVHINPMGKTNDMCVRMGEAFENIFEHTIVKDIQGVQIRTMNHTKHYLFLVFHAFKHFALTGVGIRPVLDILMYQEQYEQDIDWDVIKAFLSKNHAVTFLGDLQYIGRKYLDFEQKVQFETCDPQKLLDDVIRVGVFGDLGEANLVAATINVNTRERDKKGIRAWIHVVFPSMNYMKTVAPYLEEKPWLLLAEWIKRIGRFIKRANGYQGNLIREGISKSNKRMELLKKYGL